VNQAMVGMNTNQTYFNESNEHESNVRHLLFNGRYSGEKRLRVPGLHNGSIGYSPIQSASDRLYGCDWEREVPARGTSVRYLADCVLVHRESSDRLYGCDWEREVPA